MSELGRRAFFSRLLSGGAVIADAAGLPAMTRGLPRRQLGNTGEAVPILGLGTASLGKGVADDEAAKILNRALELGVNYIDSAPAIGGYGRAQLQIGRALKGKREQYFLTTKCFEPQGDAARKLLEQNLRELNTDKVDLLYVHSLGDDKMDPSIVFGENGVYRMAMRAKEEGLTRFVGVSGHSRPQRFVNALADFDFDVVMTAVNFVDVNTYDFENTVWPFAHRKGAGLVAMKVYGGIQGGGHKPALLPRAYHEQAFRYALSLEGCATAVIGIASLQELEDNVRRARAYQPLTDDERNDLKAAGRIMAIRWQDHLGPVR
ncbi:MAG TPA: aldo/keto reductase [Longimicrobiales bacterium]|nr:aldo/keto reductase [Longimicrobiales bacterium]